MTRCERCGAEADERELDGLCPRCVWTQIVEALPERTAEPTLEAGRRLGRYTILSLIGRGGMGAVYRARDEDLGRDVALKILSDPEGLARFKREVVLSGRLNHPNIVPVHEVGEAEGVHFFAMALVDGPTLEDVRLEPAQAMRTVRTLARAVQFAHEQGVLHRDLKPGNVILRADGEPMLTDFGLARDVAASPALTASGIAMGTPPYAAPELLAGRLDEVDARTDVYALGAILYHALTRRAPFEGKTSAEVIARVLGEEPPPLRGVPAECAAISMKALEKDRAGRYGSARELADDLDRALAGQPIAARSIGPMARFTRRVRRNPALAGALLLCVVLAALNVWHWVPHSPAVPEVPPDHVERARAIADRLEELRRRSPVDRAAMQSIVDGDLALLRHDLVAFDAALWFHLGRCHAQLNERVRALDYLSRGLALDPALGPAYEARVRLWLRDYLELRGMPADPESPAARALWALMKEDEARAKSAALSALLAGVEAYAAGHAQEARARPTDVRGTDPAAWFLDGRCARLAGQAAEAGRSLSRALELDPEFPEALAERGLATGSQDDLREAVRRRPSLQPFIDRERRKP